MARLLELPTEILLEKIGAGNHKPGSGSAAALNGILSCRLILTVLELTLEPKRRVTYNKAIEKCEVIKKRLNYLICPRLEELFQTDSDQFDLAIKKRKERDLEPNQKSKNQLDIESLIELKKSTELPIEIAKLSVELAQNSLFLFDKCFASARGDSCVALNNALASISGCISIISLNLQSFAKNEWTEKIKGERNALQKIFGELMDESNKRLKILEVEADRKNELFSEIFRLKARHFGKSNITVLELENLARDIQNTLWAFRKEVWKKNTPQNELEILSPKKVIRLLKYAYKEVETLGIDEFNESETGGIIDNTNDVIYISTKYALETRNFTGAHELGHALLHDLPLMHRDIPLNSPNANLRRSKIEIQADKFASFFLMPRNLVIPVFKKLFGVNVLKIDEETAFAINNSSIIKLQQRVKTKREFARLIAKTNFYNSNPVEPIHKLFNVSIEAMAIRLEELNLVKF